MKHRFWQKEKPTNVFTVIDIIGYNSVQSRHNPTRPIRYLNDNIYNTQHNTFKYLWFVSLNISIYQNMTTILSDLFIIRWGLCLSEFFVRLTMMRIESKFLGIIRWRFFNTDIRIIRFFLFNMKWNSNNKRQFTIRYTPQSTLHSNELDPYKFEWSTDKCVRRHVRAYFSSSFLLLLLLFMLFMLLASCDFISSLVSMNKFFFRWKIQFDVHRIPSTKWRRRKTRNIFILKLFCLVCKTPSQIRCFLSHSLSLSSKKPFGHQIYWKRIIVSEDDRLLLF